MTHICIGKLTIIGSDNGLVPGRRQAIIWTNAGILLIEPLGRNSSEILIAIQTFSFKKTYLKISSAKWHPFCLGLNVLIFFFNIFRIMTTLQPQQNGHHSADDNLKCTFFNTLRLRQNGGQFPDVIFKCIFYNERIWISIEISLKIVPKGPINNIPALVQIMAWRRSGDKPLSEPMLVSLLTHICVTRPQWVNENCCILIQTSKSLFMKIQLTMNLSQVMAWNQTMPSHYLNQGWKISTMPYSTTGPE